MTYPENIEEIKKCADENRIDVKYLLGEIYEWNLFLSSVQSLPSNTIFNVNKKVNFSTKHKVKVVWS